MIKKFEDFSLNENDHRTKDIDANEDISKRTDLAVSTEIDPAHEVHPTISVYFPDLFMYIDLEKIDVRNYNTISEKTAIKIGEIVQELDGSLDFELRRCLENMQNKIKTAASKIQQLP